ncbi:ribonuclease Z [Faecalimonas umbilicata]|nr:ribonuclease Z [Faecalimonas umbilicata]
MIYVEEIMIVVACIDERKGMMFNCRRQSRDRAVCNDILKDCEGHRLYMTAYSKGLFEKMGNAEIVVSEDMMQQARNDDSCFIEDIDISGHEKLIQEVILYQWNRHYPADTYFPLDLSEEKWVLEKRDEFQGSSHEKITKEVYKRRKNR